MRPNQTVDDLDDTGCDFCAGTHAVMMVMDDRRAVAMSVTTVMMISASINVRWPRMINRYRGMIDMHRRMIGGRVSRVAGAIVEVNMDLGGGRLGD